MNKIAALSLAAVSLALAAAGASAQTIYKWRDASGLMHISDSPPPPDVPAKNIISRTGAPAPVIAASEAASGAAASGAPAGDSELLKRKAKIDEDKAKADALAKAKAEQQQADARAANCASAQQQMRTMSNGGRIVRVNANGEKEFLDDATIAAELRRAQDSVAQNCGPAKAPQ